jgi:hypothetical protein
MTKIWRGKEKTMHSGPATANQKRDEEKGLKQKLLEMDIPLL